jgi:hypothetical protein
VASYPEPDVIIERIAVLADYDLPDLLVAARPAPAERR